MKVSCLCANLIEEYQYPWKKVDTKLMELLGLDVLEKVWKPVKWVTPMVPILKENGDIRICLDMRRHNKTIIRENHPLPTMDQLLHCKKC